MELAEEKGCLIVEGPQMPQQGAQVFSQNGGIVRGNDAIRFAFLGKGESAHGPGAGQGPMRTRPGHRWPLEEGRSRATRGEALELEAAVKERSSPACGATNREKHVAGFHLFFIFLSAVEFIPGTCPHCSDLSRRAVSQYKDNS